jgi:hypothetical protein
MTTVLCYKCGKSYTFACRCDPDHTSGRALYHAKAQKIANVGRKNVRLLLDASTAMTTRHG